MHVHKNPSRCIYCKTLLIKYNIVMLCTHCQIVTTNVVRSLVKICLNFVWTCLSQTNILTLQLRGWVTQKWAAHTRKKSILHWFSSVYYYRFFGTFTIRKKTVTGIKNMRTSWCFKLNKNVGTVSSELKEAKRLKFNSQLNSRPYY